MASDEMAAVASSSDGGSDSNNISNNHSNNGSGGGMVQAWVGHFVSSITLR
jgi:hypothetical protein